MKATVSTETTTQVETLADGGLFRKAKTRELTLYVVSVSVDFAEEERAILTQHKLWDSTVWTDQASPSEYYNSLLKAKGLPPDHTTITLTTTIKDLASPPGHKDYDKPYHGTRRAFNSPVEALNFETELKTKHLPGIKRLMEASQASLGKSETLEF
jgi:hypothetical protein